MSDPMTALISFLVGAAVTAWLLWPRHGLLARVLSQRTIERTQVEDALKQLYHADFAGTGSSVESLAGGLEVSRDRVLRLLGEMEGAELVRWNGSVVELTESGRAYALEVIRGHRLLERYLADRTGLSPEEWHLEADRREHELTPAEVEELSARLGHPRWDPHGDPIPDRDGDLPPSSGVALTTLEEGSAGIVVHLEDEPVEVYRSLSEAGIGPGTHLEVLRGDPGEVRIRAAGREHRLESAEAASVEVEPLPRGSGVDATIETLAAIRPGESAEVVGISQGYQGPQRRRLLDLGVVPGTRIEARFSSASGDPVAYDIRGALIALRREQAERILVRRISETAADSFEELEVRHAEG